MRLKSRTNRIRVAALVLVATLGGGRAASAQTRADTMEVAQAVASFVGDSLLPRLGPRSSVLLGEPTQAFDRWVTLRLQEAHRLEMMPTQADTAQWVVTRGFAVRGDTAAVLVEVGTRARSRDLDTYIEQNRYYFVRKPSGWKFVRREFVSGADAGSVRG